MHDSQHNMLRTSSLAVESVRRAQDVVFKTPRSLPDVERATPSAAPVLTRNIQAPQRASEGEPITGACRIPLRLTKHVDHSSHELSSGSSCSLLNLDSSISDVDEDSLAMTLGQVRLSDCLWCNVHMQTAD